MSAYICVCKKEVKASHDVIPDLPGSRLGGVAYLWILLDGNENAFRELDVFVADDVEVFLHVAVFFQVIAFTFFNLCKREKQK